MKYRNITLAAAVALTAAMLVTGCGAKEDNTQQTQTSKTQQTQASATEAPVQETQKVQETQAENTQQTQAQQPDTEASDSEQYVDNPFASGGEGDTNGFYDDAGTWITVHKNSSGQWVDESGMAMME